MELQLQKMRKLAGFDQQQMADALAVKKRTYGSWERGEVSMSFPQAVACAEILGCTTDELAGRKPARHYSDPEQEALNGYFESMNKDGRTALVSSARLMSGSPDVRIEKDRQEPPDIQAAMGA